MVRRLFLIKLLPLAAAIVRRLGAFRKRTREGIRLTFCDLRQMKLQNEVDVIRQPADAKHHEDQNHHFDDLLTKEESPVSLSVGSDYESTLCAVCPVNPARRPV